MSSGWAQRFVTVVDVFADFTLPATRHGSGFRESDLKELARQLRGSLEKRSFAVGELFGSSIDLWAFSIDFEDFDIDVGVSPEQLSGKDDRWSAQLHLQDRGWFDETRAKRLAALQRIEWAVHDALITDFGARDLEWHLGNGRVRSGAGQPTP